MEGSNKGIRWLSWEKMCNAKEGGGLGFKELSKFSIAMLEKQGTNPSYMWRSILAAQEVVRQESRRKIGDGEQTNAWNNNGY
ncbi:putative mitochondrial protein AtMg00310 [Apium graveolens]|uniref:putative mitochondrial protein AtMg00310 n=1 Tax=Apium graveolens TaxID=4045 RepID=UPI003D7BFED3